MYRCHRAVECYNVPMVIGSMLSTEKKKNILFFAQNAILGHFYATTIPPTCTRDPSRHYTGPGKCGTIWVPETFSGTRNFFFQNKIFLHIYATTSPPSIRRPMRHRNHGITGPESRSHETGNGTRNTKPEPDMGLEPESRSHGAGIGHGNGNGIAGSDSRDRNHGIGITGSASRDQTHGIGLTGSASRDRTHGIGITEPDSRNRTQGTRNINRHSNYLDNR